MTTDDPAALEPSPEWNQTEPLTVARIEAAFCHDAAFTVGVEEELMLVDPETLDLAPHVADALRLVGSDARFKQELRASQLEIVTPVCGTVADARRELVTARATLIHRLGGAYGIVASGTHPFSTRWGDVTEAERYSRIADEYAWAATRSLICGLHVHVAVDGAARALAVFNALRSYLPEIAALAANSPYLSGEDTGMCSIRPMLNQLYPRSGVPSSFATWDDFVAFVEWGRRGGLFPDCTFLWWDVRPHPDFGTIEVRISDTQTFLPDAGAIVALIQTLAMHAADRHDAGEPLPTHDAARIAENAYRAQRYGVRGCVVDLDTGEPEWMRDRISRLLDELEPVAKRAGAFDNLADVRPLLAGNGAERQRFVHETAGMTGLVAWLMDQTQRTAGG